MEHDTTTFELRDGDTGELLATNVREEALEAAFAACRDDHPNRHAKRELHSRQGGVVIEEIRTARQVSRATGD